MKTINEMYDLLRIKLSEDKNIDNPSEYDIGYSDMFSEEGGAESPVKYDLSTIKDKLTIFNQGSQTLTTMACGCYGSTHCINAMNLVESNGLGVNYEQKNPIVYWNEFLKTNPSAQYSGSSLQDWIAFMKDKGIISGSARCYTIEEAKSAIDNNRLIYTGSNNGDWNYVKLYGVYKTKTNSYGHLFCLVGYNDQGFIGINSYGDSNGYFILPYSYWNTLYSRNALCDNTNKEAFDTYNKIVEEIKSLDYKTGLFPYYEKAKETYGVDSRMFEIIKKLIRRKFIIKDL